MSLNTVGHSNLAQEELIELLRSHGVGLICDVRAWPRSRRNPHFDRARLEVDLPAAGIDYAFLGPELGGHRPAVEGDERHRGLREPALRAYAEHMRGSAFARGVARVLEALREHCVAVMCAECDWRRCHRRMLADHVVALRHIGVVHLLDSTRSEPHLLHPALRVSGRQLVYDGPAVDEDGQLSLFD